MSFSLSVCQWVRLESLIRIPRENIERIEVEGGEIEKAAIASLTSKMFIILKEILLPHFLENVKEVRKQEKEDKVFEKCIRTIEMLKDVIIIKRNRWKSWCIWKTMIWIHEINELMKQK